MPTRGQILVIGAQGTVGRPVVRRLLVDGFRVRVLARDAAQAAALLPGDVQLVTGDLMSIPSLESALEGCSAVYLTVDTPPRARGFRPETDGLSNLITAARVHGTPRLLVLSALGVSDAGADAHPWWHIREKAAAQKIARESKLPWTVFEPAWLMETMPAFIQGKSEMRYRGVRVETHWIAGDDYGRMISSALTGGIGQEQVVRVQGRERLSISDALSRFLGAYDSSIRSKSVPLFVLKLAGLGQPLAAELVQLFRRYETYDEPAPDPDVWRRFATPVMDIEGYAAYVHRTGDFPQKKHPPRAIVTSPATVEATR